MKTVYQKNIDKDKGDCMQAAIASLFDKDYDEVPKFIELEEGHHNPLITFLRTTEYQYEGMLHNPMDKSNLYFPTFITQLKKYNGVDGYFYASVYSPKYFNKDDAYPSTHAVIIDKKFNIVFDPNPENKDVKEYPMAKELGFNGIINVYLIEKKEVVTRKDLIEFLEKRQEEQGVLCEGYKKTVTNSDEYWTYVKPAVDGMMPCFRVLEDKVIYSQPSLYGDSEPDEEYSFEEMKKKIIRE